MIAGGLAAAAGVVVALVSLPQERGQATYTVTVAARNGTGSAGETGRPSASVAGSDRDANQLMADREIADLPVLPGATEWPHAPAPFVDSPAPAPAAGAFARRWWTAPGTVTEAISYLRQNPPHGMAAEGGTSSSGAGQPSGWGVIYGGQRGQYPALLPLTVMVYPTADGVIVCAAISTANERY
jgi:hypothetical protein